MDQIIQSQLIDTDSQLFHASYFFTLVCADKRPAELAATRFVHIS
jgi:hypothetical protein